MEDNFEQLVVCLIGRGLVPQTIPAFLRDVARVMIDSRYVTCAMVNILLSERGWPDAPLDESSLDLVLGILEQSNVVRIQRVLLQ
ncbi:MAG: hypothetical protein V2A77_00105 [Pseudomonadota bacterium]